MYCALYRKWRPLSFDDVVSQGHITTILKNQIAAGKTAHAYIFTGSRGTGKTTCARIFAKAVNCLDMHDGEPCLECDICKQAESQTLTDIIEIDAASNTGVDDVRSIKESAFYLPEQAKYKIYIIDEVHMLSPSAFNALLKILEEPPEHIKFILATTEIHKIPATILSRCQRFDFSRIKSEDIRDRLLYIASKEDFELDSDAAELIARLSDGGMRDAISMLDQCTAYSDKVDLATVSQAVGTGDSKSIIEILDAVFSNNAAGALNKLSELYYASKDMQRLCDELLSYSRNLMLIKSTNGAKDILTCTPDEYTALSALAEKLSIEKIISVLEGLEDISERIYKAPNKRISLEAGLVKLCSGAAGESSQGKSGTQAVDIKPLLNRISRLEAQLKAQEAGLSSAPVNREKHYSPLVPQDQGGPVKPAVDVSKIRIEDFKPLSEWNGILAELSKQSPATSAFMNKSSAYVYQNIILVIVNNRLMIDLLKDHINILNEVIMDCLGKPYAVRVRCAEKEEKNDSNSPVSRLLAKAKENNISIEVK